MHYRASSVLRPCDVAHLFNGTASRHDVIIRVYLVGASNVAPMVHHSLHDASLHFPRLHLGTNKLHHGIQQT